MSRRGASERDVDFIAFVSASNERLFRLALLLAGDPHHAADLVQEALERAYLRWRWIRADDPYAYVRRIVVNLDRKWWQRSRRREWLTGAPPDGITQDFTEQHAQRALIEGILGRLTRRERVVVVLRFYCDMSEPRIGAELGIATGTVKSTLSRALAKLRTFPEFESYRTTTEVE